MALLFSWTANPKKAMSAMIDSRGSHARLCMWPASPKPETDPVLAGLQPSDSSDRSSETPFLRSRLTIRRAPLRIQCPR